MTATTDYPDMNAEKRSLSPHSDNVYRSQDGRMVRVDVDPVPMDSKGRCRMWDIKAKKYRWLHPIDAKEWIAEGTGSWTEVEGSTIADSAKALITEGAEVEGASELVGSEGFEGKSLAEMSFPEMVSYAEALGVKVDGRWGEGRIRNVIDAKLREDAEKDGASVEDLRDSGMPPS